MTDRQMERMKKESLIYLEVNRDIKTHVTQQQLTKLMSDIKRLSQQKNLVVMVVNDGEPPVTAITPDVDGKVTVTVPATAGALRVTAPDVSPETTIELIFFPL